MSRFVNAEATRTVDLGPCECPGTPHDSDWAKLRDQLSGSEIGALQRVPVDEIATTEAVAPFITEWNLLGPDGEVMPISAEALRMLTAGSLSPISEALSAVITESVTVPNGSSVPSPASSRGNASRTRTKTRTPGT